MIFGFLPQNSGDQGGGRGFQYGVAWAGPGSGSGAAARERLAAFRSELYRCFTGRADALFELADAVLCADGPVRTLAGCRWYQSTGAATVRLYDAVNPGGWRSRGCAGRWRACRCRAGRDGRIRLGVDVSTGCGRTRPTSPERLFCHVYGRGKGQAQMIPGWPYSVVAALEPGRTIVDGGAGRGPPGP